MIKNCYDCPVAQTTDIGMYVADTGCLTDRAQAITWFEDTGKLWACHKKPTEPCAGLLNILIAKGKTIDFTKKLITEHTTLEEIYDKD